MKVSYYTNLLPVLRKNIATGTASFLLIILLLTACSTEKRVVIPNVAITSLPGYTVRDTAISHHDFNVWVITTETSFDSLFTTVITSAYKPRFDEQIAVAIKAETATTAYNVSFKEMVMRGRVLNVYFNVQKEKPDQEGAGWVSVTAFPKNQSIRRVNFYHDNVMIRSIPVVLVY